MSAALLENVRPTIVENGRKRGGTSSVSIALPNADVARTNGVQRRSRKTSINGASYRNGLVDSDSDINRNPHPNPHSRSHSRSHAHSRSRSEVQYTNARSRKESASSRFNYRPPSRNRRNSLSSSDNSSDTSSTLTLTGSGSKISARALLGIVLRSHLKTVAALRDELAEMKEKVDTSEAQSQATTQHQGNAQALTITAPQPTHPPADPNPILLTRLRTLSSTHATTTHQLQRTQAELALYKASYARAQDLLVEANAYIRDVEDERDGLIGEVEEAWGLVKRGRRSGGGGGGAIQDVGGTRYGERMIVDDRDAEDEGVSGIATRDGGTTGTRPPAPVQQNSNQPPPLLHNDRDRPRSSSTHATNVTQIHYPASALSAGSSTAFSSSSPPPPRPPSSNMHPIPPRTNTISPTEASPTPPNPPRSRSASITGSTSRSGPRRVPVPSIAQVLTRAQQNEQTPKQAFVPASQLSQEILGEHDVDDIRTRNGDYRRDVEGGSRDLFGQGNDARARSPQNNVIDQAHAPIPFPSREHDSSAPSSSREMVLASSSVPNQLNQLTSRDTAHEGTLGAERDQQIPRPQNRAHFGTPQHPIPVPISNAGETLSPPTSETESDTVTGNEIGNLNSFYNAPRSNYRPSFDIPPTSNFNNPISTSRLGPRPMTPHSQHLNVSAIPENITIRSPEVPHAYTGNSNSSSSFPQAGASTGVPNRARTPGPGARRAVIQIAPSADADADVGSPTETSESSTVGGEDDPRGGGRRVAAEGRGYGVRMQIPEPSGRTVNSDYSRPMERPTSRLEREDSGLGLSGMVVAIRAPEQNTPGLNGAQDARQRAREEEQRRREAQFQDSPASTHSETPSPPPPPPRSNGRQPMPLPSIQAHQAHLYTRPRMNSSTSSSSSSGSGGDIRMRTGGRSGIATPIATPVGIRAQSPTSPTSPVSIQPAHPASHMHRPIPAIPIAPSSASAGRDIHIQRVQSPAESRSSTGSPGTPTQRRLRRMSGLTDLSAQHVVNVNVSNIGNGGNGHAGNGERVRERENNRWSSSTRTSSTVPQIHIEPPSRSESGETIHTLSRHPIQIPASDFSLQQTDPNLLSPEHALQPLPFDVPSDALVPHGYREHGAPGPPIPVIPSRPMSPVTGFDHRTPIFIAPSDASGRSTPDMHFGDRSGGVPAGSGLGFRGPIAIPLSSVEEELPPGFVPHTAIVPDSPDFTHGQTFPTSGPHHASPPSINGFPSSHPDRIDSMSRPLPVPQEVVALGGAADTEEELSSRHLPLTRRITDHASELLGRRDRRETAELDTANSIPSMPRRATTPAPTRAPPSASRAQGHITQSTRSESPVIFAPIPISISDRDSEANLSDLESTSHSETSRPRGGYNSTLRRREGDYFTSNHHQERNFSRFNDPPAIQAFS